MCSLILLFSFATFVNIKTLILLATYQLCNFFMFPGLRLLFILFFLSFFFSKSDLVGLQKLVLWSSKPSLPGRTVTLWRSSRSSCWFRGMLFFCLNRLMFRQGYSHKLLSNFQLYCHHQNIVWWFSYEEICTSYIRGTLFFNFYSRGSGHLRYNSYSPAKPSF